MVGAVHWNDMVLLGHVVRALGALTQLTELEGRWTVSGDGRAVVLGGDDGNIFAVRADTGAELWRLNLGSAVSGSPTLVGNRIYVTAFKGGLWALVSQ